VQPTKKKLAQIGKKLKKNNKSKIIILQKQQKKNSKGTQSVHFFFNVHTIMQDTKECNRATHKRAASRYHNRALHDKGHKTQDMCRTADLARQ